ncbi:MAG TPA: hypothetical protein VGY31_17320 [Terriglobia bacterium]|nr:hypothetical protein [Terriglobia bacterium]
MASLVAAGEDRVAEAGRMVVAGGDNRKSQRQGLNESGGLHPPLFHLGVARAADRGIFALSFATALLILAGSYFQPQLFNLDAAQSTIFIAIAALVYYNENRYSAMLGMVCPPLWYAVEIFAGTFLYDFHIVFNFFRGTSNLPLDKPLNVLAWIAAAILCFRSLHAWRREIRERFLGKTFWICLAISLAYIGVLALWYMNVLPE